MAYTEQEKDEIFLFYSRMDRNLYFQWKAETASGTREATAETNTKLLEHALKKDYAVKPNLDQYKFLAPEKRAEIEQRHAEPKQPRPNE